MHKAKAAYKQGADEIDYNGRDSSTTQNIDTVFDTN
jgi:hypothetical protein